MKRRYVTVDVFTDRMFGGNAVAVVLDVDGLSDNQMQAIAIEFNYSETTFILPPKQPDHSARVRIFTPSSEVPFAGAPECRDRIRFGDADEIARRKSPTSSCSRKQRGSSPVSLIRDSERVIGAELRAPEPLSRRAGVSRELAAACLSLNPEDIQSNTHEPQVLSVGLSFLVVELTSREALCRATPSRTGHDRTLPLDAARSVYAYTRGESSTDIYTRMFTPRMTEDPATESAAGAVAALIAEFSCRRHTEVSFRFMQGVEMGRPSLLVARARKEPDGLTHVYVGGHCVSVMRGTFNLPSERRPQSER